MYNEKDELDVILDRVWGEPMPSNTDPQTEEKANVFRSALLTALKREHSSVFKNPKTEAEIQKVHSTCLAKLKQQQPRESLIIKISQILFSMRNSTLTLAAEGHCKTNEETQRIQNEIFEVTNCKGSTLSFDKNCRIVSFSTTAGEHANQEIWLVIHDQFGNELVKEFQSLAYENGEWYFQYDLSHLTKEQQQIETITIIF